MGKVIDTYSKGDPYLRGDDKPGRNVENLRRGRFGIYMCFCAVGIG